MICDNITQLLDSITQTAINCGRDPREITLVAVSKGVGVDQIKQAIANGQTIFGENYLQESTGKIVHFPQKISWHFIGHLQSNKTKLAAELFDVVETVDRLNVAQALDKQAKSLKKKLSILVQVNTGKEKQKSGVYPEEAEQLIRLIAQTTDLRLLGLMTIPPYYADPEKSRPYFKTLKTLAEQLAVQSLFADNNKVALSMGMSGDYQVAIEEGATIIRVGTALFGARTPHREGPITL